MLLARFDPNVCQQCVLVAVVDLPNPNAEVSTRQELSDGGPWSTAFRYMQQHLLSELDDLAFVFSAHP